MKKRVISLLLAIVMILGMLPAMTMTASAGGTGFTDVVAGSFYEKPVQWAVEQGITSGETTTTFNPGGQCLRAHVVTFLWKAEKCPAPTAASSSFTDVPSGAWYEKPVLWAVEKGITSGVSATKFGAADVCSRYQVVYFLWAAAGKPEPKTAGNPFKDVKTTDFFYKSVLWAVEQGITSGVDNTHFGPGQPCNRAQVVTFLYRAFADEMDAPLTITGHPQSVTVKKDDNASFTVAVSGGTAPYTYQWQISDNNGAEWFSSSVQGTTYSAAGTAERHGRLIRCIVTDANGSKVISNAARLLVSGMLKIIVHPKDVTAKEGTNASFTVVAAGAELQYQWQYSIDNGAQWYTSSARTDTYTTAANADRNGRLIRCVVTDGSGNEVTSNAARLRVTSALRIVTHPQDVSAGYGSVVCFSVEAVGSDLHYQWQYSDDGADWRDTPAATASYAANTITEKDGRLFRCIVTDADGAKVSSHAARLRISNRLRIQEQPGDVIAAKGETASFTVTACGNGLTYCWQHSDDDGATWADSGVSGATCSMTATDALHGRLLRCIVADADGNQITTDQALLMLRDLIIIKTQPVDISASAGTVASISIDAAGKELRYRWEYSDDEGGTWMNADGIAPVYTAEVAMSDHGRLLRCVITDANGVTVTSDAASITVEDYLRITGQPQDLQCSVGDSAEFSVTAEGTDLHYMWQYSTDGAEWYDLDMTDRICAFAVTEESFSRLYRCRVWNDRGRAQVSDIVSLTDPTALILVQPKDWICGEGSYAHFEVVVSGNAVSCQWQMSSNDGRSWSNSSINGAEYSTTATGEKAGWLYRCVVTDDQGREQISDVVSFTIENDFLIAAQPENASGELYEYVPFQIQVGGKDITYRWQMSPDGDTWTDVGSNNYRYRQQVVTSSMGQYIRCIVTNTDGKTLTSDVVQLRWNGAGFFDHNGRRYYAKENGQIATGLEYIDGSLYGFYDSGILITGLKQVEDGLYYFTEDGSAARSFVYFDDPQYGTFYFGEDHTAAMGWTEIDGNTHYFYDSGMMAQGLTQIGSKEYYFDPETGVQTYGLVQVGLNHYMYFPEGGDQPFTGLKEVNGSLYGFSGKSGEYGVSLSGAQAVDGETYYFDPETKQAVTGFVTFDDRLHYFGSDYTMVTDALISDGENIYLFNSKGTPASGLSEYDGRRYYCDSETGAVVTGMVQLPNGYTYCFQGANGAGSGLTAINGALYQINDNGIVLTGRIVINGKVYYFDPVTGKALSGWQSIRCSDNKVRTAYFDPQTFQAATGLQTIAGAQYYFDANGWAQTGERTVGGVTYYFSPGTFRAYTGGTRPARSDVWGTLNGAKCFYGTDGKLLIGLKNLDGALYYFGSDGRMQTGFVTVDGTRYYFDTSGARYGKVTVSGSEYYFSPSNYAMLTGLQRIDGAVYYYQENGVRKSGWITDANGDRLYMNEDGLQTGLAVIDGKTYYFNEANGIAHKGYRIVSGKRYYFDPESCAAIDKIYRQSNGYVYSVRADGGVDQGWTTINGNSYFFYPSNNRMAEGLASVGDQLYYFDIDRGMLRNTTVTVGGVTYRLDGDGFASAVGDSDLAKLINEGISHLDKGYGNEGAAENPGSYSCSQYVRQVFSAGGVDIPMGVNLQYHALTHGDYNCLILDDLSQAKAGDIVFYVVADCKYGTGCLFRNEIHHVGVYLGDGKLMDSNESAIDGYSNGPMIQDIVNSSGNLIYKLVRISGVNGQ